MPLVIPIINKDVSQVMASINERLSDPVTQRKVILVVVSIALLLDNMLYMVIVPIIPDYLRRIGAWDTHREGGGVAPPVPVLLPPHLRTTVTPPIELSNASLFNMSTLTSAATTTTAAMIPMGRLVYEGEDSAIGLLFASKAMVQLMINPFSGHFIDRIGYGVPMMIGLTIMFMSTAVFACGETYTILFMARSLQGAGSAFADTAGLAMIADKFTIDSERTKALGIANAFISFGCLVAPPFGGLLYEFGGKQVPFMILSLVCLGDAFMVFYVFRPTSIQFKAQDSEHPKGTPLWRLLIDPHIAVCAGALSMANVSLAFLEPTISKWMMDNMDVSEWQIGLIWLPAFVPHVFGVYLTVKLAKTYPQYQWLMAAGGLALEGLSCFIVPFARTYWVLIIPLCGICFGVALIDTAILPMLAYLVDVRYVSVYGSIYAIADISYSLSYAFGPIIAGGIVESIGFLALNIVISITNLAYVPVIMLLRHVYDYKPFEDEENILMNEAPVAQYQTYVVNDGKPRAVDQELKNHLDYTSRSTNNVPAQQQQQHQQETGFTQERFATWDDTPDKQRQGHVKGNPFAANSVVTTGSGQQQQPAPVPVSRNPFANAVSNPTTERNGHTVMHRHISSRGHGGGRNDGDRMLSSEDES